MTRLATGTASGMRLALFAAALLLAIGAMLALAATAAAQGTGSGSNNNANVEPSQDSDDDVDDGQTQGGSPAQGSGSGSADDDSSQDPCSRLSIATHSTSAGALVTLQDRYFARTPGSGKAGTDKIVAAIDQSDRLTELQRQCALYRQDQIYPNLRWGFQTRCPRNTLYSFRPTGASRTIDGVEFRQWEKIEDYECTSRWSPLMTDGSTPPDDLIPPGEPISIITVKYRVRTWVQWSGFDRASVPAAPADESTLADD